MNKYVALLRGVNVSGQKIIKMEGLRKHFDDLGYRNVQTYIQSGNVVFESKKGRNQGFEEQIQNKIRKEYTFDVVVILKTPEEIEKIISKNPFDDNVDQKKLYVTILTAKPVTTDIKELNNHKNKADKFIVKEDVIYILYDEGAGKSDFSNNFIEKKLHLSATTRNWNTMNKLLAMLQE